MDYTGVYNYINEDMGSLLDPLQRAVMLYEVEQSRQKLITQLATSVEGWINAVCNTYGTTFAAVNIPTRKAPIVEVRQVIMWGLAIELVPHTLTMGGIGAYFTNAKGEPLNHATVLHARKSIKNKLDTDQMLREKLLPLLMAFGWKGEYLESSRIFHLCRMDVEKLAEDIKGNAAA